jgi:hypothetical protein
LAQDSEGRLVSVHGIEMSWVQFDKPGAGNGEREDIWMEINGVLIMVVLSRAGNWL